MRLATKGALIGLCAIFFAIAAGVFAYKQSRCPKFANRVLRQILTRNYAPGSDIEFDEIAQFYGRFPNGGVDCTIRYLCADCVEVETSNLRFSDASQTDEYIRASVGGARRVVEQSAPHGEGMNQPDAERVVLINERGLFEILRRKDNKITRILSVSPPHAMEFERRRGR